MSAVDAEAGVGGDATAGAGFRRPSGRVRAFVALPCPTGLRSEVADGIRRWRDLPAAMKWSDPDRIHLTLRFLGDASPTALEHLHDRLADSASSADPVTLTPGTTGAFPRWERTRVVWVGFEEEAALERLAAAVERDARAAGFEPEERPFVPHLTLGRVKGRRGVRAAIDAVRGWRPGSGPEEVDEMILYESELGPGGATHTPLARYPLGGAR